MGEIEWELTTGKKITLHLLSRCCSFAKKKKTLLKYYFCALFLYFQDFYQVWKIAGQISRLFQEFKTLFQPWA